MKKLVVFYDDWCPNCKRFIRLVKKLDWLDLVDGKKLRNPNDTEAFKNLNLTKATEQMASSSDKENWKYGFISLYRIFSRIPLFWLVMPLFLLLKISHLGQFLYKELAIKRRIIPLHCDEENCRI